MRKDLFRLYTNYRNKENTKAKLQDFNEYYSKQGKDKEQTITLDKAFKQASFEFDATSTSTSTQEDGQQNQKEPLFKDYADYLSTVGNNTKDSKRNFILKLTEDKNIDYTQLPWFSYWDYFNPLQIPLIAIKIVAWPVTKLVELLTSTGGPRLESSNEKQKRKED